MGPSQANQRRSHRGGAFPPPYAPRTLTNSKSIPATFRALVPHLSDSAAFYLYTGIAANTRQTYDTAQRSYLEWARCALIPNPIPATSLFLCEWIAWLGDKPTRPGTIRGYLSGLRSLHTDTGQQQSGFSEPHVDRVLRGVRRYLAEASRRRRLPITLPILVRILGALKFLSISQRDRTTLAAAWSLAYVGGLRCGEITYDCFNPAVDFARLDFKDYGDYATVRLPASKTDPYRKGVIITIPSVPPGSPVDPLCLLRDHLHQCPFDQIALFVRAPTRANVHHEHHKASFPRSFFVDCLRRCLTLAGLNALDYAGHSFRRGLATWAKLAGNMDDGDIKLLGRWSSEAVKLYQEAPLSHIANLARVTLRVSPHAPPGVIPPSGCWWGDELDT